MTDDKRSNKDIFTRMIEIHSADEIDSLDEIYDQDIVVDWPQSRERIRGRENYKAIARNYPGKPKASELQFMNEEDKRRYLITPMFTTLKVEGAGDNVVASVKLRYPDGSDWYVVSLATVRDEKIIKMVQFWVPVYEAPEWRSQWAEPIGG